MSLSRFRYFLKVAKLGSIREAAEVLYVAPSAISRQIGKLEEEFGSELLMPHGRGIRLTAAGEALAQHAATMLGAMEQARSDIDDLVGLRRGHIKTWSVEGSVNELAMETIRAFQEIYPMVTHELTVASSDRILQALADGDADLGIVFHPPNVSDLRVLASGEHTMCVIASPSHPACRSRELTLATLSNYPLALPDMTFGLRHFLESAARAAGVHLPPPMLTTNSVEALKAFARLGSGLTVLPAFAVADDVRKGVLQTLPLNDLASRPARTAVLTQRNRKMSIAAAAFVEHLTARLRASESDGASGRQTARRPRRSSRSGSAAAAGRASG
ncbi:MAG: LysR family transcriptional regulator [Burkholderiaceae bacterium]